jgi:hypothetical protein
VTRAFDHERRLSSLRVNTLPPVSHQYDHDSYLVAVGDLTLGRDAESGLLTGTTLGVVAPAGATLTPADAYGPEG